MVSLYRVLKKWRYNTHVNAQKNSTQHMSRNQCLLRYVRVNVWVGILGDQPL
jgi:hypothetical protein